MEQKTMPGFKAVKDNCAVRGKYSWSQQAQGNVHPSFGDF